MPVKSWFTVAVGTALGSVSVGLTKSQPPRIMAKGARRAHPPNGSSRSWLLPYRTTVTLTAQALVWGLLK